jgi:DNA-binding CsgD family transcriptional regulator
MNKSQNTILKLDSRDWHEQIARIVSAQDTPQYPGILVEALRSVVSFDHSVSFAYRGQERPICTFDTFTPKQRIIFVSDYLAGPYLLDPFYQIYADRMESGLYRLREIAPDRFYHSEYYRNYYRRTGLAEEIGFLVTLPHDMMLVISLMRAGTSSTFSDRDLNKLRRMEPIIHASSARHWRNLGYLNLDDKKNETIVPVVDSQIIQAFDSFGEGILTPRECEVVRLVLRGHSSNSIGRQFQISTGTVKIHRKNIYAKLGISSQSELFSHFISYLSKGSDPIL